MSMKNIYLIGIGGIGMSAIARYYHRKGYSVAGYDRTPSELTRKLEAEGIDVHYEDLPQRIPGTPEETLVVYTPAVPDDLGEMVRAREGGFRLVKRSRMLGEIAEGQCCLAVAGTHGKTTTSTLLAHLFTQAGGGCTAFLGGISKNYDSNLLVSAQPVIVAEADEFDRSFLQLHPDIAVITAMDADHLDIYGDLAHVHEAFRAFASQVKGTVIAKLGLPLHPQDTSARILHYSYEDPAADFHAACPRCDEKGCYHYDLVYPGGVLKDVRIGAPGRINAENSVAALAVALCHGLDAEALREAAGTFQGVRRRMDVRYQKGGVTYIDDYAHHPQELSATIKALREMFPGKRLTAVFQPHLYTRTRDFAEAFAEALSAVDRLLMLDIYPAREAPIPGVSSRMILEQVTAPRKELVAKDKLVDILREETPEVLVTFGAGDIDRLTGPIAEMLREKLG